MYIYIYVYNIMWLKQRHFPAIGNGSNCVKMVIFGGCSMMFFFFFSHRVDTMDNVARI